MATKTLKEWAEYMQQKTRLPIEAYIKTAKCLLRNMTDKEKIELLSKWIYEYNSRVLKEKGIKTIDDFYKAIGNVKIRRLLTSAFWIFTGKQTFINFKRWAKRTGKEINLDNYAKYLSRIAAKKIANNPFYFEDTEHVPDEAWFDFLLGKFIEMAENILADEKNREMMNVINHIISQNTTYGRSIVELPKKFCILIWSNAAESWRIAWGYAQDVKRSGGGFVELDANMVVVPYSCNEVRKVVCFLDYLPLYVYSYEYKKRYVPTELYEKHSADWARRRLFGEASDLIKED